MLLLNIALADDIGVVMLGTRQNMYVFTLDPETT
jgi:hypothetical protein